MSLLQGQGLRAGGADVTDYWDLHVACSERVATKLRDLDLRLAWNEYRRTVTRTYSGGVDQKAEYAGQCTFRWVGATYEHILDSHARIARADFEPRANVERVLRAIVRALDDLEFRAALISACAIDEVAAFLEFQ